MKKIKMLLILLLLMINIFTIMDVYAASNPYKQKGPYGTNCTWFAWKMAYEKGGYTLPGWGNAKNWYKDAKEDGYDVGSTPKARSIVVWGSWTPYGHVGYVERVEGNVFYVYDSSRICYDEEDPEFVDCISKSINEQTDNACYAKAKKIACEYTINPDDFGRTGFIYLDSAPKKTTTKKTTKKSTTSKKTTTSKVTTKVKSNNVYLSNIELSAGIIDFDKEVYEYDVEVDNEIDEIMITAIAEDDKVKVEGEGEYDLVVGTNKIKLVVTAEDKTKREYIINVIRTEEVVEEVTTKEVVKCIEEKEDDKDDYPMASILLVDICFVIMVLLLVFIYKKI